MRKLILCCIAGLLSLQVIAQAPKSFSYQAVARDISGNLLAGKTVSFRISILAGSSTGLIVYSEVHSPVTNPFGLATLEIGNGFPVSGTFADIDWGKDKHYVRVEMDPEGKSAFQMMGVSQLLSVPYALYAGNIADNQDADADSTNEIQKLTFSNGILSLSKNGGAVTLPVDTLEGDNWGKQTVVADSSLTGTGTASSPLKLSGRNALTGQVLKWNGMVWAPADDLSGITTFSLPFAGSTDTDGPAIKINNSSAARYANAIWGSSGATTGLTNGVRGSSMSVSGNGLFGEALAAQGLNTGVYGYTASTSGRGVYGLADAASGSTIGILGQVNSPEGQAIRGIATDSVGTNYGVVGISNSLTGYGIFGIAGNKTGFNVGVMGSTNSESGTALYGVADVANGTTIGVRGKVVSPDGYSGYFTGGRFYIGSNVGIGTQNPSAKLEVAGQIKITGGSPGNGKVLTSGADGTASWVTPFNKMNLPYYDTAISDSALFKVVNISEGISEKVTGLWGQANHTTGTGVRGTNLTTSGTGKGVWGEVVSPDAWSGYFKGGRFYVGGKVGIGTSSPTYKVDVIGDRVRLSSPAGSDISFRTDENAGFVNLDYSCAKLVIQGSKPGEDILMIPVSDSKVGIRNWSPVYHLDVSGSIRATEGIYYGGTSGDGNGTQLTKPDFVFAKAYKILRTDEVAEFVEKEKHLPWLTSSEQEKEENGEVINMTRMTFETLESVENLQMQIIEQHKMIKNLSDQNERLQKENEDIITRINYLEKLVKRMN